MSCTAQHYCHGDRVGSEGHGREAMRGTWEGGHEGYMGGREAMRETWEGDMGGRP